MPTPQVTQGPYYLDSGDDGRIIPAPLLRQVISEGKPGIPMRVELKILGPDCRPLPGLRVDIWHADAHGVYSGYAEQGDSLTVDAKGSHYCRGTQITDRAGDVMFDTIFPGWYRGRTMHVHVKVFSMGVPILTSQIYVPDAINEYIYLNAPDYVRGQQRDTVNATDRLLHRGGNTGLASIRDELNRYVVSAALVADPAARPVQGIRRPAVWPPAFGPKLEPEVRTKGFFPSKDRTPL